MRQYQLKETKEITKIICNRCGKETKVVSGIPKREMIHVEHTWGYFSGKDNEPGPDQDCKGRRSPFRRLQGRLSS